MSPTVSIPCEARASPVLFWFVTHSVYRMKKLLIGFLCLLVLAAVAIGISVWKIGAIVATYKPQIQRSISDAVGAQVTLGDISISFLPTTRLSVDSVTVETITGGASELSVGSIRAKAALLPLLSRRVEISSIEIHSPRLTLVKDANGVSVRGVTPKQSPQKRAGPSSESSQSSTKSEGFSVDVRAIEVYGGALRFEDQISKKSYTLDSINLRSSISLQQDRVLLSEGSLDLRALKKHKLELIYNEISFNQSDGSVSINTSTLRTAGGDIAVSGALKTTQGPGSMQLNSTSLSIAQLLPLLTNLVPTIPPQEAAGTLSVKMEIGFQGPNVQKLTGTIGLKAVAYTAPSAPKISGVNGTVAINGSPSDLTLSTTALGLSIDNSPLQLSFSSRLTPQEISLTSCKVVGFGGELTLPSTILREPQPILKTTPVGRNLSISQILRVAAPSIAETIQGTLRSFDGRFTDMALANPAQTVAGNGAVVIKDGVLKGFNLANQVMSNVEGLPFISGNLRKRVPPEFEKYFASPDTVIRDLNATFTISAGVVQLSELRVLADVFSLTSQGSVGLDGQLNLRAAISFDPELSNAITNRVLEMKPLLNKDGRLSIPLLVKGRPPAVAVVPDVTDLAQRAAVGTIRETLGGALRGGSGAAKGLGKGLGKVLGF